MPEIALRQRPQLQVASLYTSNPDFSDLRRNTKVRNRTPLKSPSERAVRKALQEMRVRSYYEFEMFPVGDGIHSYYPDFMTEMSVGGRQVILEPHGACTPTYLQKLGVFRENKKDDFYLVLISDRSYSYVTANMPVDEYWKVPSLGGDAKVQEKLKESIKRRIAVLLEKADIMPQLATSQIEVPEEFKTLARIA